MSHSPNDRLDEDFEVKVNYLWQINLTLLLIMDVYHAFVLVEVL